MKIKVSVQVIECKTGDIYKEAERLLRLATKGIVTAHASRLKGMGNNIFGNWNEGGINSTMLEIEDEEEKKVEA